MGKLSEKSLTVMRMFASGLSEDDVLKKDPAIRREHITIAAREALILNNSALTHQEKLDKILQRHPRAYEKWSHDEEQRVLELYKLGKTMREISAAVQRQPTAIKNRLNRLGLFSDSF